MVCSLATGPASTTGLSKLTAYLSKMGFPCRLTHELPDEGIIVTHREFFKNTMIPNRRQLFVCAVADFRRHPLAQLHIVQNPSDPLLEHATPSWPAAFIPMWPESGLIPRDPARGDLLVNVAYFGLPPRLAPQLRSEKFAARLREHGFNFRIVSRDRWNDYSDTDAVLAVRSFAPSVLAQVSTEQTLQLLARWRSRLCSGVSPHTRRNGATSTTISKCTAPTKCWRLCSDCVEISACEQQWRAIALNVLPASNPDAYCGNLDPPS